ncbi:MAG: hypothetical protein AAF404_22560 [Pseudomonadota bacterium]
MVNIVRRKIKRYRSKNPYEHELLFGILGGVFALSKFFAVLLLCLLAYVAFERMKTNQSVSQQVVETDNVAVAVNSARSLVSENTINDKAVRLSDSAVSSATQTAGEVAASVAPSAASPIRTIDNSLTASPVSGGEILFDQEGSQWILDLPGDDYVMQFASTPDSTAILEFAREYLRSGAVIYTFKRTPSGRPVYGVASKEVHSSLEAAQQELQKLPVALRQANPWIRPIAPLQRAIRGAL